MASRAKAMKPDIELVGVQAELYPSMYAKLNGARLPCGGDTLAEGIAVKEPGVPSPQASSPSSSTTSCWSPNALERAVACCCRSRRRWSRAPARPGSPRCWRIPSGSPARKVGLVLCGGNIDTRLLANVLLRDLARSGRLARLRITLQDRPGALYKVMKEFDAQQVNIIEIYHQRIFTTLPAKGLITDIECEARDRAARSTKPFGGGFIAERRDRLDPPRRARNFADYDGSGPVRN